MIVVTVELYPAQGGPKQHLGTAYIVNDGSSTSPEWGNYNVMLSQRGRPREPWKQGRVVDFPRRRLNSWYLLQRALNAAVPLTNPDKEAWRG